MGTQAVALALINRLRWRCLPDENGKCIGLSGCTEGMLVAEGAVDYHEYEAGGLWQKVLVILSKIN